VRRKGPCVLDGLRKARAVLTDTGGDFPRSRRQKLGSKRGFLIEHLKDGPS
jgi:hypothetical protein